MGGCTQGFGLNTKGGIQPPGTQNCAPACAGSAPDPDTLEICLMLEPAAHMMRVKDLQQRYQLGYGRALRIHTKLASLHPQWCCTCGTFTISCKCAPARGTTQADPFMGGLISSLIGGLFGKRKAGLLATERTCCGPWMHDQLDVISSIILTQPLNLVAPRRRGTFGGMDVYEDPTLGPHDWYLRDGQGNCYRPGQGDGRH